MDNLDVFSEQIIIKKKTGGVIAALCIVWVLGISLGLLSAYIALFYLSAMGGTLMFLGILAAVGLIYAAFKISSFFYVEYEYALTNGCFDIDKIVAKSNRKRLISSDCDKIESFGKYNLSAPPKNGFDSVVYASGDITADDNYYVVLRLPDKGRVMVVFEPDEKILRALKRFMPRRVLQESGLLRG